ncbi:UTRA domain-containing protein [Cryobacterium sp. TMT1-19]|nr:UTRA domain-containing protein [Cryobacterium sp. TMT1-19]
MREGSMGPLAPRPSGRWRTSHDRGSLRDLDGSARHSPGSRGVTMSVAKQRIAANASESALLFLPKGAVVLTMTRTAFENSGRAVEFGQRCYAPDFYSFENTLVDK